MAESPKIWEDSERQPAKPTTSYVRQQIADMDLAESSLDGDGKLEFGSPEEVPIAVADQKAAEMARHLADALYESMPSGKSLDESPPGRGISSNRESNPYTDFEGEEIPEQIQIN